MRDEEEEGDCIDAVQTLQIMKEALGRLPTEYKAFPAKQANGAALCPPPRTVVPRWRGRLFGAWKCFGMLEFIGR